MKKSRIKKPNEEGIDEEFQINFKSIKNPKRLSFSNDFMTASNSKGYLTAISSVAFKTDSPVYFEIDLMSSTPNSCWRIGICNDSFNTNISLGSDPNSYCIRSKDGYILHNGSKREFGEQIEAGDVIGVLIEGSNVKKSITFFKNGMKIGNAFNDIPFESFYGAVSLYMGAKARFKYGRTLSFKLENLNY